MTLTICDDHTYMGPGHAGCDAEAVQRALKRRGYRCSQYQGAITTDAPRELIDRLLGEHNERIARRTRG